MGKWTLEIEDKEGDTNVSINAAFVATEEDMAKGPMTPPQSLCVGMSVLNYLGVLNHPGAVVNGNPDWAVNKPAIVVVSDGDEGIT